MFNYKLIIKIVIAITLLILTFFILKWTGVLYTLQEITGTKTVTIENKTVDHESKPSTPDHKSDIQEITEIQKLIMDRIKAAKK